MLFASYRADHQPTIYYLLMKVYYLSKYMYWYFALQATVYLFCSQCSLFLLQAINYSSKNSNKTITRYYTNFRCLSFNNECLLCYVHLKVETFSSLRANICPLLQKVINNCSSQNWTFVNGMSVYQQMPVFISRPPSLLATNKCSVFSCIFYITCPHHQPVN
jgi:hypothetical protein